MSQMTFVVIHCPAQDSGNIVIDHMEKKLYYRILFSSKFDLWRESELKKTVDEIRQRLFQPIIQQINSELPEDAEQYVIGKPKTVGNVLEFKKKIVIPAEINLEVNDDVRMVKDQHGLLPLHEAVVSDYRILEPKLAINNKYSTWPTKHFGSISTQSAEKKKLVVNDQ